MNSIGPVTKKVVSLMAYQKNRQNKPSLSKEGKGFFEKNIRNNKLSKERESILREKSNLLVLKKYKIKS